MNLPCQADLKNSNIHCLCFALVDIAFKDGIGFLHQFYIARIGCG